MSSRNTTSTIQPMWTQVVVFEKVLGARSGHVNGIEHKPSSMGGSNAFFEVHSHLHTQQHTHVLN